VRDYFYASLHRTVYSFYSRASYVVSFSKKKKKKKRLILKSDLSFLSLNDDVNDFDSFGVLDLA